MNNSDTDFIKTTQNWLNDVVIQYNLCPFAKRERDQGSIRFFVEYQTDVEACLFNLVEECFNLDKQSEIATTLIIYAQAFADFDDYLDYLALAEDLLIEQGYEGIYQLASFHPNYYFSDVAPDDSSNYTNRSPYPMLHLLREHSIEQALMTHPDPSSIPQRNIHLMRQLGTDALQNLLAACYAKHLK